MLAQIKALVVELDGGQLLYPDQSFDDFADRVLSLLEAHGSAIAQAEKAKSDLVDAEEHIQRLSEILEKNGIKNF